MRIVFANVSALVSWESGCIVLNTNDPWDSADPFVRDRPDLFSGVPSFVHRTAGHVPGSRDSEAGSNERRRGHRG